MTLPGVGKGLVYQLPVPLPIRIRPSAEQVGDVVPLAPPSGRGRDQFVPQGDLRP